MSNFALSTVSVDGLAPSGARPSAATVMTEVKYCVFIYTWDHLPLDKMAAILTDDIFNEKCLEESNW